MVQGKHRCMPAAVAAAAAAAAAAVAVAVAVAAAAAVAVAAEEALAVGGVDGEAQQEMLQVARGFESVAQYGYSPKVRLRLSLRRSAFRIIEDWLT